MSIRILVSSAFLLIALQLSALGQGLQSQRDAQTVQNLCVFLQDFSGDKILPVRGGTKDKPLGCYIGSKDDVQFRSGYKDVDPRTQCEWAYDLHQYIVQNGGGWDNYQKYVKETPVKNPLESSLGSLGGAKDTNDPWDRAHVPYDKQAAFADKWWKENSHTYGSTVVPPKDWWIHDAVLDGNNIWTRYEELNGKGSADFVMWRDAELAKLLQRK